MLVVDLQPAERQEQSRPVAESVLLQDSAKPCALACGLSRLAQVWATEAGARLLSLELGSGVRRSVGSGSVS
jgi:hypothetical protein